MGGLEEDGLYVISKSKTVDNNACYNMRLRTNCNYCVQTCPVQAIDFSEEFLRIDQNCLQCNRCVAVCPSGAISSLEINIDYIYLECQRIAPAQRLYSSSAVKCFAAFNTALIIELHNQHQDGPVFIDRGLCATCPAAKNWDLTQAITESRNLLQLMATLTDKLPRIMHLPPATQELIQAGDERLNRRKFFTNILRSAEDKTLSQPITVKLTPRQRLIQALEQLAARQNKPKTAIPTILFNEIWHNHNQCCEVGICAAVCPTTAIYFTSQQLVFDAQACIGCGSCVRNCPQQNLTLYPKENHTWYEIKLLANFTLQTCPECGRKFNAMQDDNQLCRLCSSCQITAELIQDVFSFDARRSGYETNKQT